MLNVANSNARGFCLKSLRYSVVELEADGSDLWVDELLASSYKISYTIANGSCSL